MFFKNLDLVGLVTPPLIVSFCTIYRLKATDATKPNLTYPNLT